MGLGVGGWFVCGCVDGRCAKGGDMHADGTCKERSMLLADVHV